MQKIILISCSSTKLDHIAKAKNLYISPLFKYNLKYAQSFSPAKIFILSAKYGLLSLEQEIEPYNETLNKATDSQIKDWAEKVIVSLQKETNLVQDEFVFLAGEKYRRHLVPRLVNYSIPMKGMLIGEQLSYLKNKFSNY